LEELTQDLRKKFLSQIRFIAIAVLLVNLNYILKNHVLISAKLDSYRTAWIIADRISTEWSYADFSPSPRLLDLQKICKNCTSSFSNYKLSYRVIDLKDNISLCSCGTALPSSNLTKIVKLPVAIRFSQNRVHPGILEIEISQP